MSSTWNGSALLERFYQKYGLSDTTSQARVLEWINEIQEDICSDYNWPFLKFKMKKRFSSSSQELDLRPQIPTTSTLSEATSGGTLASGSVYRVKITFLIFGEDHLEVDSLESEPSVASSPITITSSTSKITASMNTYLGSTVNPTNIHRRVYLSKDGGAYYLYSEIENNSATTVDITADTSSTIEPPEYCLVACIAKEDPVIESSGRCLSQSSLGDILRYDPNLSTTGVPDYYARVTNTKIFAYPALSADTVLSYWVYRVPARVFNSSTRAIQLHPSLKKILDAGVTWKAYEYRDRDGQETKLNNYEAMKKEAKGVKARQNAQGLKVKEVI